MHYNKNKTYYISKLKACACIIIVGYGAIRTHKPSLRQPESEINHNYQLTTHADATVSDNNHQSTACSGLNCVTHATLQYINDIIEFGEKCIRK